jgi:bromodomain adjacent to zinc finger domain protein 1A
VDRDAAVASPWTVKPPIAKRYGVDSIMPEETRQGVENIKKGEIDKRKKIWEDKEGPPTKKQKKMTAAQGERSEFPLISVHIFLYMLNKIWICHHSGET